MKHMTLRETALLQHWSIVAKHRIDITQIDRQKSVLAHYECHFNEVSEAYVSVPNVLRVDMTVRPADEFQNLAPKTFDSPTAAVKYLKKHLPRIPALARNASVDDVIKAYKKTYL